MRIIFLDIDGVLNDHNSLQKGVELLPEKVLLVDEICKKTGANIIISSSWREDAKNCTEAVTQFQWVLGRLGLVYGRVIGATPCGNTWLRGNEIEAWLDKNKGLWDQYIILDDNSDMLPEQLPRLVLTHSADGITRADVYKAIELFGVNDEAQDGG